nr:unnamed protein product [Ipomoea batatas]
MIYMETSVGERSALVRSLRASRGGRSGSENVGLSNANIGENPMPRKPKGSSARFVHGGVRRGRENASSQCSSTRRYGAISDWYFYGKEVNLVDKKDFIKDCFANKYYTG